MHLELFVITVRIRSVEQCNAVFVPLLPKFLHDLGLYLTSAVACQNYLSVTIAFCDFRVFH